MEFRQRIAHCMSGDIKKNSDIINSDKPALLIKTLRTIQSFKFCFLYFGRSVFDEWKTDGMG